MATLFTKIVNGEIPCHTIAEDERCLAFLDIMPLAEGHTLVIPKKETDYLFDIDDSLYQYLFLFSKKVAMAVRKSVPCKRIGMAVVGLEVPHAHIHLIPLIQGVQDMNFARPKLHPTTEQLAATAEKIRVAYNGLG